jgi:hypothetical protein
MEEAGMDTEHCTITELLALKDAPDDALLDQVEVIGERAARHMLTDEAARLQRLASGDGLRHLGRPHRHADPTGVIGIRGMSVGP